MLLRYRSLAVKQMSHNHNQQMCKIEKNPGNNKDTMSLGLGGECHIFSRFFLVFGGFLEVESNIGEIYMALLVSNLKNINTCCTWADRILPSHRVNHLRTHQIAKPQI